MANAKNLKSNAARTPEELKAMGTKGGKASGEARAKKRATKLLIRDLLSLTPNLNKASRAKIAKVGYDIEAQGLPTIETIIHLAIASQAMAGDIASARMLLEYAQIPDIRVQLERERLKAQLDARRPTEARDDPLAQLLARIDAEAAQPEAGDAP